MLSLSTVLAHFNQLRAELLLYCPTGEFHQQCLEGGYTAWQTLVRRFHSARMSIGCNADRNVSCSKVALLDVFHPDRPQKKFRVYAIVDEQSNASMISPELADGLGISGWSHQLKENH
jgi:hypothetical protein